jgi:hypothetical protein
MLRRLLSIIGNPSRKDRRSQQLAVAPASRKLRLFLESLEDRLVPSGPTQSGNTLYITENAVRTDSISETASLGGDYTVVTSYGTQSFTSVTNIVFNAAISGVSVYFNSSHGYNTTGNVSITGQGNYNGLFVEFDGTFNVNGKVSVTNTGTGSSTDFVDLGDTFAGLTLADGSAVSATNTFANVSDAIHNASSGHAIKGTMVDLEGTTIQGATSINFGAGGGYFLTDYSLDLGNGGNDGASGAAKVHFNGDLTVADNSTRGNDTFQLDNANVSGNVSINVSSIGANESLVAGSGIGGISITNYSIAKNLSVILSTTSGVQGAMYLVNSSVTGSAAFNESGSAQGFIYVNFSSINGSLTVNESAISSDFSALGSSSSHANTLGGSVTIQQSGFQDTVYLNNLSSIKGAVSINQAALNNSTTVSNDAAIASTVTINQLAGYSTATMNGDAGVNGSLTINQSNSVSGSTVQLDNDALNVGAVITQSLAVNTSAGNGAAAFAGNDSIKGNLSITQGSGYQNYFGFSNSALTSGTLTINQSASVTNVDGVYIENGSTITGNLSISQLGGSQGDLVDAGQASNSSIKVNGSVSITQKGGNATVDFGAGVSAVNGSITLTQTASGNDSATVADEHIGGTVTVSQSGADENQFNAANNSFGLNLSVNQSIVAYFNGVNVDQSLIYGSLTITQASSTSNLSLSSNNINIDGCDINGSVTIAHAINGGGLFASAAFGSVQIGGSLSIAQTGGYSNWINISGLDINGSVTINQSGGSATDNQTLLGNGSTCNSSVSINQSNGVDDLVQTYYGLLIEGAVTIKQGGTGQNQIIVTNGSFVNTSTITQGSGYDDVLINASSSFSANVSITGSSSFGSNVSVSNSSLSKNITITEAAGNNDVSLSNNAAIIQNITINLGGGSNIVDLYDSKIYGMTTINEGMGLTAVNVVDIESDASANASWTFQGLVTVNMGAGTNTVNIGQNGTATFDANTSFTANTSGYNTYSESNTSGSGTITFKNF